MFAKLARQLDLLLATRKRHQDRQKLLSRAVDAVVAGTDPRIRAIGGYRKKLCPAIRTSVRYVEHIVAQIPGPEPLAPSQYGTNPTIHACFSSVSDLRDLLAATPDLHPGSDASSAGQRKFVYAFLAMERQEKQVFAPAMVNGMLRHDVAQTLVSFANRRVVAVARSGHFARRALMRMAFDDLIASALDHLAEQQQRQQSSSRRSEIQRMRLQALRRKREGLGDLMAGSSKHDHEIGKLEKGLQQRDTAANEPPRAVHTLEDYLDQVVEVFSRPEQYLPFQLNTIHLTRMNRKLPAGAQDDVNAIQMAEAQNSDGLLMSVFAVRIPRNEIPPPAATTRF